MVGAAGAGKSTFARRWFDPDEVLSSDAYRALVSGDPADQRATRPAFAALHRALRTRLRDRRLTVVDATNVKPGARVALLRPAADAGLPAVAIVLDLPVQVVIDRNAARAGGEVVPESAIRRQLADLGRTLAAERLAAEGFAATWVVRSVAEQDRVIVSRASGPGASSGERPVAPSR